MVVSCGCTSVCMHPHVLRLLSLAIPLAGVTLPAQDAAVIRELDEEPETISLQILGLAIPLAGVTRRPML